MQPVDDQVEEMMASWRAEMPELVGPTTELTKRIMVLSGELSAATKRELPEFGLTMAEFDVLATLRRAGKPYRLKPNELSRALLLSTGGTSNVVNHLVSEGLVERESDPDDGRSTLISLTSKGAKVVEDALRVNTVAHAEVFEGVPPEVLASTAKALRELSAAMRTALRSPRRTSPR
jgi:DNA-binding MarR family transcriptional regulator